MSIDVDLDQPELPAPKQRWLDSPRRVVAGVAVAGVLVIAAIAVTSPSWRATPAPAAAPKPAADKCLIGAPPLPAFTITLSVAGDLYEYEDTGRWTWQQMVWIPAAFDNQPGLRLIELQTPRGPVNVTTGGPHQLALRVASEEVAKLEFAAGAVYDQWALLTVASSDVPRGDVLTISVTDAEGSTTSRAVPLGEDSHSVVTGFGLLTPDGGPESEVKYGPPSFTVRSSPSLCHQ